MGTLRRRFLIVLAVAACTLAAWQLSPLLHSPKPYNANNETIGGLERQATELSTPWGDTAEAELFRLVLPENRAKPGGNRIEVAFERLRTTADVPLPPVFVLAGGPGASGIELGRSEYFYLFREIQKYADVVLIDQRGTGLAVPNLQIPGQLDLPTDISEETETRVQAALRKRLVKAIDSFRDKGVDVTAYNSRENADDLDAIRAKLGYETITLLGYSYGTELSTVYLDRHPEHVANAVWFGPTAPDLSLKLPSQVQGEFEGLERLVDEDPRLRKLIPHLTETMRSVHASLAAHPVEIHVPLMDAVSDDDPAVVRGIFSVMAGLKPNWEMTMGRLHLELMVQDTIGNDAWLGRFPAFYYRLARGDYHQAGNILRNFRRRSMPNALLLTTNCTTGYTDARWNLALEQQSSSILSVAGLSFGRERAFCDAAGLPRLGDEFLRPIESNVPVLFIAGTLDGRTSIENLPELQRRFPNNATITVVNGGHNQLLDNAIRDGLLAFLRGQPRPVGVVRRRVRFETPVRYEQSLAQVLDPVVEREDWKAMATYFKTLVAQHAGDEDYVLDVSEEGLNNYGYELLARGRTGSALAIFRLNVELHPESWNAFDSLGEGLQAEGRLEEAERSYEKSIELNFLNVNGRRRLNALRK